MKLYTVDAGSDQGLIIPDYILTNEYITGISISTLFSQYFGMVLTDEITIKSFSNSFISQVKSVVHKIADNKKEVCLYIIYGDYVPDFLYTKGYDFVDLIESHHEGVNNLVRRRIQVPVPYNQNYIDLVELFISWLTTQLKKDSVVWNTIKRVNIGGIGQLTPEIRVPDQDFQPTGDPFVNAANKWLAKEYTEDKIKIACQAMIDIHLKYFTEQFCSLDVIPNLAGFPCIKGNQICLPKERTNISADLIKANESKSRFMVQYSDLETKIVPSWIANSSAPKTYQLERLIMGVPILPYPQIDQSLFKATLDNGIKYNADYIEIFFKDILAYPDVIKQY